MKVVQIKGKEKTVVEVSFSSREACAVVLEKLTIGCDLGEYSDDNNVKCFRNEHGFVCGVKKGNHVLIGYIIEED